MTSKDIDIGINEEEISKMIQKAENAKKTLSCQVETILEVLHTKKNHLTEVQCLLENLTKAKNNIDIITEYDDYEDEKLNLDEEE